MNDEEPQHPTILIQFTDQNGLPIDVEPGVIAGILMPFLSHVAQENRVQVGVTYGYQTNNEFEALSKVIESRGTENEKV